MDATFFWLSYCINCLITSVRLQKLKQAEKLWSKNNLSFRVTTGEVPGSNPGKGKNLNEENEIGTVCNDDCNIDHRWRSKDALLRRANDKKGSKL